MDAVSGQQAPPKKEFQCGNCDYSTRKHSDLKRHVIGHTVVNLVKCSECEYETARISDLKRHQQLHIDWTNTMVAVD